MEDLQKKLEAILDSSHLRKINSIRDNNSGMNIASGMRNITPGEVRVLEKQNNTAQSWNSIQVTHDFIPDHIRGSRFSGRCRLGRFDGSDVTAWNNVTLPCGIYDSTIDSSSICSGAAIHRCGIVSNYIISQGSVIFNCGSVTAGRGISSGNGEVLPVGPETGERSLGIFAEMNMALAAELAEKKSALQAYGEFLQRYTGMCRLDTGYIGERCIIRDATTIEDSFISDNSSISGTLGIARSTILSSADEPAVLGHGVQVEDSIVQHGCRVLSGAGLYSSLLMEHSEAEKRCIINSSIIGPNSSIGEGEITSTLAGPFTVAHHQSLLIACIWTGGRGNIGYGANVGSNHTSRLPDQEIFPGEGMFFGLGSSIKYPADFRRSPYTVISTGTVTLPQRMEFPFSLVTQPEIIHEHIPAMYNELKPAWMLARNIYTLIRNETKYRRRNRARRDTFDFTILRPGIIDMMVTARDRLLAAEPKKTYTDREIPGAGKNFITSEALTEGAEAYTLFIRYYCLREYARHAGRLIADGTIPDSNNMRESGSEIKWLHALKLLAEEGLAENNPSHNMEMYIEITQRIYSMALSSRMRDYERGSAIINDYAVYHDLPENDPVIKDTRDMKEIEVKRAAQIISMLK